MLEMLVEPSRFLVLGVLVLETSPPTLGVLDPLCIKRTSTGLGNPLKNDYPVVMTKSLLLNMAIEIVDLPNFNMVDLPSHV